MRRIWMTQKRLEKGLKQYELAHECGVSNRTISSIELGNREPSGKLAMKIAETLNIDMSLFFKDKISA
ncbi:helix-turn-helix transcriptional regulator [Virgibacillus sp. CBA3643]|uniref:helix-turn-helix transcriptional regulator n=1 Tax=Virgibacillus sp. CBA3643 TaxID=2942278 RepID=UPI0035A29098